MQTAPASTYRSARTRLLTQAPSLAAILPEHRPPAPAALPADATVAALRTATATFCTGLIVLGWGDGTAVRLLAADPTAGERRLDLVVFPAETGAFAHCLGEEWCLRLLARSGVHLHLPRDAEQMRLVARSGWATHNDISRIAGARVIDAHPLLADAARDRTAWLPGFQKALSERLDSLGNDVYDTFMGAKHALMHGRRLVDQPRNRHLHGRFAGASAICIAAGPSASHWYDRIRAIQDEHVIICVDSLLGGLLDAGIEPDIVTMVERQSYMAKLVAEPATRCRTHMWALPVVHPDSLASFDDRLLWWWNLDDLYPWLMADEPVFAGSGRSTGTMGVTVAAWLGCRTIYLAGHDLAYVDGSSHTAETNDFTLSQQQSAIGDKLNRSSGNYYTRLFDVPANGGGTLETTGIWELFRSDIEDIIRASSRMATVVNLGIELGTGAAIAGTVGGSLPEPTGRRLDKTLPAPERRDAEWGPLRDKALRLEDDLDAIAATCHAMRDELDRLDPLTLDRATLAGVTERMNITKMVSPENRKWVQFVFRAAMRNLMLRLQHNTHVRTRRERDWNQTRVMDLYCGAIPDLIDRLRPELSAALEPMR